MLVVLLVGLSVGLNFSTDPFFCKQEPMSLIEIVDRWSKATSVWFLEGINQLVTQCLASAYGAKFVRFVSCVIFICPVKIRLVLVPRGK